MENTEQELAARLLRWHAQHGRHDLPWQQPRTPYRVWISEIMLQQTQVRTAIPYFNAFMASFPDLQSLAAATLDAVLSRWAGLGYYARARNLHKTARIVASCHDGKLPEDLESLQALPGIGRSTAGAILAMGYQRRAAILDANVKRVLCRHEAVRLWPGSAAASRALWTIAETHTPLEQIADYTQAIMDLGATVCTARRPSCDRCPLQGSCKALRCNLVDQLPVRKAARVLPVRHRWAFFRLRDDGRIYLQRRAPVGVWGGLWSLPESDASGTADAAREAVRRGWLDDHELPEVLPEIRHTFSHYHLVLHPLMIRTRGAPHFTESGVCDNEGDWFPPHEPVLPGLPAPIRKWLLEDAPGHQNQQPE